MKRFGIIGSVLLVLLGCLYALLPDERDLQKTEQALIIHCAAGLQRPVEEIARQYEAETGVEISINFGGSGQLYTQLELVGGDIYLPADMSYLEQARVAGLVDESRRLSTLVAELIVAEGNPKRIYSLADLTRDEVSVVIAERSAAIGLFTHAVLEQENLLEQIEAGNLSKMGTVNEVALQVELGVADVGIVWNVLEPQFERCEFVQVAEFQQQPKSAGVGVLKGSNQRVEAIAFIDYLVNLEKGVEIFRKHGFNAIESIEKFDN